MKNITNRLVSVPECPVCNSGIRNRVDKDKGILDGGNMYLKFIADKVGMSIGELSEEIKIYQCGECKSFWCDPWFDDSSSSQIFTQGSPDHPASWSSFEQWLCKPDHASTLANKRLYKILENRIGIISRYAEYGCPFNGFFLFFRGLEVNQHSRINIFSKAMKRSTDPRWSRMMRIHNKLNSLISRLTIGYFKLSLFKERGDITSPIFDKENIPVERVLFTKGGVKSWGNNCVRYGGSCQYFSSKVLNTDIIPFDRGLNSIRKNTHPKYNLLGIFNMLDHTDEPLNIVRDSLVLAENVLIVSHTPNMSGRQHLFAFDNSFSKYLATILDDKFIVSDLTESVYEGNPDAYYKHHNYILISRV